MRGLLVIALIAACSKSDPVPAATGSAGSAAGSAAVGSAAGNDPWSQPAKVDPNAPPSLLERAKAVEAACPTVTAPYFFEVTAKNGKVSHMLGTRHISVGLAKFPASVTETIKSAKLAVFEVSPDDHGGGIRSHDEPLRDELGSADWKHFEDLIGKNSAGDFAVASPTSAAVSMMVLYEDISNMLDKQIEELVAEQKIPARGLETAAFQDKVLDHLLDLRMLKATIEQTKDRDEIKKQSHDDLDQYCNGTDDSPGMDEESRGKMLKSGYTAAELDAMDEELVFARNRSWIPKLEQMFEQGDVFLAVGADHLIGTKGVPSLLEARGLKVKRLTPPIKH